MKDDFPLVTKEGLTYLDSAATAQVPQQVLDAITRHYEEGHANIHRGFYPLSIRATEEFEAVREKSARLLNAPTDRIILTSGTTDALNMVAWGLTLNEGDEILLTPHEHHANIVPWHEVAKRTGARVIFCNLNEDLTIDIEDLKAKIGDRTKVLGITHVSNTLGTITPLEQVIPHAKERGVFVVVDGAQAVAHMKVDVAALGCDAYAFSAHKLYGPTGVGVLYLKDLSLHPYRTGGDMIDDVTEAGAEFACGEPRRFEGGTQNLGGVAGLGAAIDYLEAHGFERISVHGETLLENAWSRLSAMERIVLYGPRQGRIPVISFSVEGVPPHDVAEILARDGVCIRAGKHCTHPLHTRLGLAEGTCRVSFGLYNTEEDIDRLLSALEKVRGVFG
jgi:cysteine desulfurase/selenocysteine lyase